MPLKILAYFSIAATALSAVSGLIAAFATATTANPVTGPQIQALVQPVVTSIQEAEGINIPANVVTDVCNAIADSLVAAGQK
jgi:hypothetical protein